MKDIIEDARKILRAALTQIGKDIQDLGEGDLRLLSAVCNIRLQSFGETRIVTFSFNPKIPATIVHCIVSGDPQEVIFDLLRIKENVGGL